MKILNFFIDLVSKTIGEMSLPFVDKEFNLDDYFQIEEMIRDLSNPFVVGIVKTKGHGSNLLIQGAQFFSKDKRKRKGEVTHALAHIGIFNGFKHRVVESIGGGIRECSLLKAIGQRDIVVLRKPNPRLVNDMVCKHAIEYIKEVAKRDAIRNIKYDNGHDYSIITMEELKDYSKENVKFDCSETVMQALEHGFRMTSQASIIKMVKRGGKSTWTPADILYSDLFITIYDSRRGL